MIKTKAIGTGRRKLAAMACATVVLAGAESALAQVPGRCEVPVSQRAGGEAGCYLTATESLGAMSADPVYWHLYNYPTRAAADQSRGRTALSSDPSTRFGSILSPNKVGGLRAASASR
jgi:hypothetical protein